MPDQAFPADKVGRRPEPIDADQVFVREGEKICFPTGKFVTLRAMSKSGHHILLIALLVLLGYQPLQAWSAPAKAQARVDSHCLLQQQEAGGTMAEAIVQHDAGTCVHCQDADCNGNECNMPSCPTHQGQAFSVIYNNLWTSGLASGVVLPQPEVKIPSRNDPPLIRPPITLS